MQAEIMRSLKLVRSVGSVGSVGFSRKIRSLLRDPPSGAAR